MNRTADMQPGEEAAVLTEAERMARVRLIRSENIGPATFHGLITRYGTATQALDALPEIAARAGRRKLRIAPQSDAEREWTALARLGGDFLIVGDRDYPAPLAAISQAPPVLATVGRRDLLARPMLGVVGARNASANGRTFCRQIVAAVGDAGIVVVSGLARGMDGEAHRASLATGTIAVVAGGIDIFYPPENRELQAAIGQEGLVIAEAPLGAEPMARHFPRRNRIISGLSLGVLVIEAQVRSGTLITARLAGEQGREVFAVPGFPLDPRARGANRLLREGATLVETADDIIEPLLTAHGLAASGNPGMPEGPSPMFAAHDGIMDDVAGADGMPDDMDQARDTLLAALSAEPSPADHLMRVADIDAPAFHAAMLELEIAGRVTRHAGNRFSLVL